MRSRGRRGRVLRRRVAAIAALGFAAVTAPGCSPEGPLLLVFVLAGQSNMQGVGDADELPASLAGSHADRLRFEGGVWRPLRAAPGADPRFGIERASFGPELSFAAELARARPGRTIGIVKLAKGGASLVDWAPAAASGLYAAMIREARAALASRPAELGALLFLQGEADARERELARAYRTRFEAWVAQVRNDLGAPDLPVLYGRVNPPIGRHPHVAAVQQAQDDARASIPGVHLVPTEAVSKHGDDTHYDAAGQLELGRRFARSYLTLLEARGP